MNSIPKFLRALSLVILLFSPVWGADDLDQNLVAKWTFKDGSLVSDSGEYTFTAGGRGVLEAKDGAVTLRDHKYLVTPDISSSRLSNLAGGVTLWARLRFDEMPTETEVNVMGFLTTPKPASWSNITMALMYNVPTIPGGFGFLLRSQDEAELGIGVSRLVPVSAGETVNVAVIFNGASHTGSLWIKGKLVSSTRRESKNLKDFAAFGIGQLQTTGAKCVVTFEEVRIYATALDAQWLEEITPAKK